MNGPEREHLFRRHNERLCLEMIEQSRKELRYSRAFNVVGLVAYLILVACGLVASRLVTEVNLSMSIALGVPVGTIAAFVYRHARGVRESALASRDSLLVYELAMSISNDEARNKVLASLADELSQRRPGRKHTNRRRVS